MAKDACMSYVDHDDELEPATEAESIYREMTSHVCPRTQNASPNAQFDDTYPTLQPTHSGGPNHALNARSLCCSLSSSSAVGSAAAVAGTSLAGAAVLSSSLSWTPASSASLPRSSWTAS